uniref:Sushi, von Willebrand factor type A, EGF and pentraxin domain-containing protein 1-like n=1 Tax=Neolamprologus brichardi TaxID=32507 RepID=A0A3Q4H4P7_NEOBR
MQEEEIWFLSWLWNSGSLSSQQYLRVHESLSNQCTFVDLEKFITKTSFFSGQKVYYNCDVGYVAAGGRKSRLCNNGKWTPLKLKCQRKLCGSAGDVQNGQFVYTGVEFGDTATAVCDEGFMLVGHATRHCMNNGWSGRNPVCEAAVCEDPPEVSNAEITGLQHEPYTYKSVIRYSCRAGTLVGEREIWCTKHGTWSAPAPECKEITCPSPNVPNAYWTGNHNQKFQYRATIYIECNMGYVMSGPGTVYCERDGRWLPELPKCQLTVNCSFKWHGSVALCFWCKIYNILVMTADMFFVL